jgi:hypothetical protein
MAGDPTREGWWPTYSSLHPAEAAQLQANYQRDNIANAMMPQQALSGGTVQYSTPGAPTGVAPQAGNADIPADLLARMSPTDIALFRKASAGQAIPTGVAGPYGGGAMGQPQIPSGYNAFSGAGLPPTNIGQGGLTPPSAGDTFAGGGSVGGGGGGGVPYPYVQGPYPMPNVNNPNWGSYDIPFTGHSFDERFPGGGGSSVVPQGPQAPQVREGSS